MNKNRMAIFALVSFLLVCSFVIAQPSDTAYWYNTPTPTVHSSASVDHNLCITIFGVVSLALVIYLFKKKTFSMAENEVNTNTSKRAHAFHVSH